jgi:hypothetical protein
MLPNIAPESLPVLLSFVRDWCAQHVKADDLAAAEQVVQAVTRCIAEALAQVAVEALDGRQRTGCSIPCPCGRSAEYKGMRERFVVTLAGIVRVERAYYYCKHCKTGVFPWDRRQGLDQRQWSPNLKALICELAASLPYANAVSLLERTCGIRVEESSAEQVVEQVGGRLREAEAQAQESILDGSLTPLVPSAPPRLYLAADGVKAHINGEWHEVKVGVVYEGKPGDDGIDRCGDKSYLAAQMPAEAFGEKLYAHAAQEGLQQARETVFMGDGADWIWNTAETQFPGATQIVDYYHACEHIGDLANLLFGEGSPQAKHWSKDHFRRLKAKGPDGFLRALRRLKPANEQQREAIRLQTGYFKRHRDRMMYHQFRARGLMIGSGPVEAGCKSVVGTRMKQSGMRWKSTGADAILALRCRVLNQDHQAINQAAKAA